MIVPSCCHYRVAQNKIPQQTICNHIVSCYQWSDFHKFLRLLNPGTSMNLTLYLQFFTGEFFGNTRLLITNGQRTHRTLILLITMSGELCLNATRHFNLSQIPSTSWRMSCKQCDDLPRNSINKAILSFVKRLRVCVKAGGGHWTRLEINCFFQRFELLASCDSLKCQISIWFQWFQYKHYDENCNFHSNCFTQ